MSSENQLADIFTMSLDGQPFIFLRDRYAVSRETLRFVTPKKLNSVVRCTMHKGKEIAVRRCVR